MTDESKIPQTDLTESTQLELGGANLDHVIAFYNDGRAHLFKPQQTGIIEIVCEDYVSDDAERKGCCTIGSRRICPCPIPFSNPDEVTVTDLSPAAQLEFESNGYSLDYVLAYYTDGSARLFKPQQRDRIEVSSETSMPFASSMSLVSSGSSMRCCTIRGVRYCPCR